MVIPFLILMQKLYAKMKQIKEYQKHNFSPVHDVNKNLFLTKITMKNKSTPYLCSMTHGMCM